MSELTARPGQAELLDKRAWHNRLEEQVADAHRSGEPFSSLFIDINNFKDVNDSMGHLVGDEIIEEVEGVVGQVTKDYLVGGRIGGDEFAISGSIDEFSAREIKQKLLVAFAVFLEHPKNAKLKELGMGLAIGNASLKPGMSASELLKEADEAMYEHKLDQMPDLTELQLTTLSEARIALEGVGLRLRDVRKYEKLIQKDDHKT